MQGKRRVITSADGFLDPSEAARMAPMVLTPGAMRAEIVGVDLGRVRGRDRGLLGSGREHEGKPFPVGSR